MVRVHSTRLVGSDPVTSGRAAAAVSALDRPRRGQEVVTGLWSGGKAGTERPQQGAVLVECGKYCRKHHY